MVRFSRRDFHVVDANASAATFEFLNEFTVLLQVELSQPVRIDQQAMSLPLQVAELSGIPERKLFFFRCDHLQQHDLVLCVPKPIEWKLAGLLKALVQPEFRIPTCISSLCSLVTVSRRGKKEVIA